MAGPFSKRGVPQQVAPDETELLQLLPVMPSGLWFGLYLGNSACGPGAVGDFVRGGKCHKAFERVPEAQMPQTHSVVVSKLQNSACGPLILG